MLQFCFFLLGKFSYFYEPLVFGAFSGFFEALDDEEFFVIDRESGLPGDLPPSSLRDSLQRRCSLWPYTSII